MKRFLFASLLYGAACSPAYADRVALPTRAPAMGPRTALAIAPDNVRAPYDVQVVRENGETVQTYAAKDRFYVLGAKNERYTIRVTNPTASRVEAVVSVDGLDVVDGESGDLRKRGYIVPPYGDVRIEGFRTSLDDVATFRFSSVDGSYAGTKGKARNVGVIAVAIFEEQAAPEPQQIVVPQPSPVGPYHWTDDLSSARPHGQYNKNVATKDKADFRRGDGAKTASPKAEKRVAAADSAAEAPAPATTSPAPGAGRGGYAAGGAPAGRAMPARPMPPPPPHYDNYSDDDGAPDEEQASPPTTGRQGLGTEFGEQRNSAARYTAFMRATDRPIAIAELRYNDAAGLMALGIPVQPLPDSGEIMMRETADPFPGDRGFARAPRR